MALTHAAAMRNAIADAVDAAINSGAGTAQLKLRDAAVDLVAFDLANPAFGAAVAGVITLQGVPIAAAAAASGDADNFQILDRDGTLLVSGSVTGPGGGGDIEVVNVSIASAQACSLDSLTWTAPS